MSFKNFDNFKNWIQETQEKIGDKVTTTVWLPSRYLEDVLPLIPSNMKIRRIHLEGTSWGSDTFQKIEEMRGIKFYEALLDARYRMRGIVNTPDRKFLEIIVQKCKEMGVRPYVLTMEMEYNDKLYIWQHHLPKKGSSLGTDASFVRFTKAMHKAKGQQTRVLDLKSTHDLKETYAIWKAFNGSALLRACSVSRRLAPKIEAVCLMPSIKVQEKKEAS